MYKVKFCVIIMHMSIIYDSTEEKTELQKRIRAELEEKRQRAQHELGEHNNNRVEQTEYDDARSPWGVVITIVAIAVVIILAALFVRR